MSYTFRFGQPDDIQAVRDFVMDAGAGLFEFLLDRALPGVSARHLVKLAVADPSSPLSYSNAMVAEDADRHLAGIALCYPAHDYGLQPIVKSIVPKARLRALNDMLSERVEGTLYLNTLATASWARGEGLGGTLLDLSIEWAAEQGFTGLSLHVWEDNASAKEMYDSRGFYEVARFPSPDSEAFRHQGPILLLNRAIEP
jgi:ribosomal protein S18 acetylase RimI-like enzyme